MKSKERISQSFGFILLVAVFVLVCFPKTSALADKKNSAVTFTSANIEIAYHQPVKSGYKSNHPTYIEVPRINHLINSLQNYVNYLKKLKRIKGNPTIRINYAPDVAEEDDDQQTRIIKIHDLGINNLIKKVNKFLVYYDFANAEDLVENGESLENIPDSDITKPSRFSQSSYFKNLSLAIPGNEPDCSFVKVDNHTLFSTRPGKKTNLIYKLSLDNPKESEVYSEQEAEVWYQQMDPSPDGKYLAYTDGLCPYVINLQNKEISPISISDSHKTTMLCFEWSPTDHILAGIVMDENTEDRFAFVYDAEKKEMLNPGDFVHKLKANHLNATPIWSPQGNKLVFTSARSVHLIDLKADKSKANLITTEGIIGEFVWSQDENSFAVTEFKGQPRMPNHFDDLEFRGTTLHRYRLNDTMMEVSEDYSQCIKSRNTIKLLTFTEKDQILYLDGRLVAPQVPGAVWDLSKTFNAYLTPLSQLNTQGQSDKALADGKDQRIKPQLLPMQYLFVYRSMNNKNTNIYDSGNGRSNLLYISDFYSCWFIGLYQPNGIKPTDCVYNFRPSPYPFGEYNYSFFLTESSSHIKLLLKFLQDYKIRAANSSNLNDPTKMIIFQANFTGILNIWSIDYKDFITFLVYGDKPRKANKDDSSEVRLQSNSVEE